jgi:NTP pyrophosphatase (non-canonical NTP hydrolase)
MNIPVIIEIVAKERTLEYCYLKLAEELFELGEILIKQVTKPNGSEDRIPHLIEELGDVTLNSLILLEKLNIHDQVADRIESKLKSLL